MNRRRGRGCAVAGGVQLQDLQRYLDTIDGRFGGLEQQLQLASNNAATCSSRSKAVTFFLVKKRNLMIAIWIPSIGKVAMVLGDAKDDWKITEMVEEIWILKACLPLFLCWEDFYSENELYWEWSYLENGPCKTCSATFYQLCSKEQN